MPDALRPSGIFRIMNNRLIPRCLGAAVVLVFVGCMIAHHWSFLVHGPAGPMYWNALGRWVEEEGIEFCRRLAFVGTPLLDSGPFPSSWIVWLLVTALTTALYWIFSRGQLWRR